MNHQEYDKQYYRNNCDKRKKQNNTAREKYRESWRKYLIGSRIAKCQICGKKLEFLSGNVNTTVHFDHRHENVPVKTPPDKFLNHRPLTKENIALFERCNFGVLCLRCNVALPTANRVRWLLGVYRYVFGKDEIWRLDQATT